MSAPSGDDWLRRRLTPREKAALVREIAVAYGRARWLLWRSDLPTTVAALRAHAGGGERPAAPLRAGVRLGQALGKTLRHIPFDARCLMRSLVLTSLLARRDIESSLVIAVQPAPSFKAHAWVESDGVPLLEPADAPFEVITRL
jgi:hypothetical protein